MIGHRTRELVLALALVAVAWYYRRRERAVRESLTLSQQWASNAGDAPAAVSNDTSTLARVGTFLDARPEEVPDRVETLDRKVRELSTDLEKTRASWADRWWEARAAAPLPEDERHVTVVTLPDGVLTDAESIAKRALDDSLGVTIVTAQSDGTLAVAVGEGIDDQRADELASEVATGAGGGAGGGESFATGGGDAADLPAAAREVGDRLRAEAGFDA